MTSSLQATVLGMIERAFNFVVTHLSVSIDALAARVEVYERA